MYKGARSHQPDLHLTIASARVSVQHTLIQSAPVARQKLLDSLGAGAVDKAGTASEASNEHGSGPIDALAEPTSWMDRRTLGRRAGVAPTRASGPRRSDRFVTPPP